VSAPPSVRPSGTAPGRSAEAELERALGLAFRQLARRERTVAETRAHLAGRGVDAAVIQAALARLTGEGYLDDARFARLFASDKRTLEQWGIHRIRRELIARGIDRELVGEVLEDDSEQELERAISLLRRRFPAGARGPRERERALGVLLRRGYDRELACRAVALAGSPAAP